MNSVTRQKKKNNLTLDWNRILSFVSTAERNIKCTVLQSKLEDVLLILNLSLTHTYSNL